MRKLSLLFLAALSLAHSSVPAQTLNLKLTAQKQSNSSARPTISQQSEESLFARRAIAALERLEADVVVYRSLEEFESNGRLARVPLDDFCDDLRKAADEVVPILSQLSDPKLKSDLTNALDSYRDGAFWWAKVDGPRVVTVTKLNFVSKGQTPAEEFFIAGLPYTVTLHWRQASKFLHRAEKTILLKKTQGLR